MSHDHARLKKPDLFNLHPNLRMRLNDADLGGFIGELLQSLHASEEQLENLRAQLIIDQEKLRADRQQLKVDQQALIEDKNRLMKFQSFIMKLADQIEESELSSSTEDHSPRKRKQQAAPGDRKVS